MPRITFVSDNLTLDVNDGASIQDIVDNSEASLPFQCRMGTCGTCRCLVEEGMENLNDKTEAEQDLFENFTHVEANERLGCQLRVHGNVKIRH